jgi:uncharacterized membrane protein
MVHQYLEFCDQRVVIMSDANQKNSSVFASEPDDEYFRFHLPHAHLDSVFGNNWFAVKAENFARFFGTPTFLVVQSVIVGGWIGVNMIGVAKFDVYPFILLNLAFSLQAAYAAPLILLAQTRQADRDKVHTDADAHHREDLAIANEQRQVLAAKQTEQLVALLEQNTQLTVMTQQMSERIEALTLELLGMLKHTIGGAQMLTNGASSLD